MTFPGKHTLSALVGVLLLSSGCTASENRNEIRADRSRGQYVIAMSEVLGAYVQAHAAPGMQPAWPVSAEALRRNQAARAAGTAAVRALDRIPPPRTIAGEHARAFAAIVDVGDALAAMEATARAGDRARYYESASRYAAGQTSFDVAVASVSRTLDTSLPSAPVYAPPGNDGAP